MKLKALEGLVPLPHSAQNRCFGCGTENPRGLHLDFFRATDGEIVCPVEVPELYEGPPGYLHGGIIATLLDEAMSKAIRSLGLTAVTRHLEVDYRLPVPSCTPLQIQSRHTTSEGRKHWAEAHIVDASGRQLVRGKALFVEIKPH